MDIIQKIMQKIAEAKTSGNAILNLGNEEKLRQIKESRIHGTTILALKCENGVIMAADRRCSAGGKIFSDRAIKIEEIGSLSAIGGAGFVSDCQWLVKALKNEFLPNFEKFLEIEEIFVDGLANLIDFIMGRVFLLTWPILAGWDPHQGAGRIFLFEPGGAKFEFDNYIACGSGGDEATSVLDSKWSCDCTPQKGIQIAIEALLLAAKKDLHTSDPFIHPPTVKIISPDGISTLPTKNAFGIAWEKAMKEQARKGDKEGVGAFVADSFLKELRKNQAKEKNKNSKKPA